MSDLLKKLENLAEVECDRPLSTMTTLRIGGNCKYVIYPNSDVSLDAVIRTLKEENIPFKLIGKGSNLLCCDKEYNGAVIRLDKFFNNSYINGTEMVAQAGCSIIALAVEAMKNGLSGLEFASGIPGTLGGTVFMNAGAYKASMSDIVKEVFVYRDGNLHWIPASECGFAYRTSIFQKHPDWIVLAARLKMEPKDSDIIRDLMENRRNRRISTQPLEFPSCGSVFRNPEDGMRAWELIDAIGYRGKCVGGACVSEKHPNFIVNIGGATAKDYMQLVEEIRGKVLDKYGILLHTEMERFNCD